MVDFHSHILPSMDDGSRSTEESAAMLTELKNQGIKTVMATPHFYANDESVSDFLARRSASYEKLKNVITPDMPQIFLGAEVRFYDGISHMDGLEKLCVEGTDLLLVEMPSCKWTEYTVKELTDIACSGKFILVLAHVERYMNFQRSGVFERLLQNGVLMQINASFINDFFTRRRALRLIRMQAVHFLGSDCHNMTGRAPEIGKAYEWVRKKFGNEFVSDFNGFVNNFIK